MKRFDILWLLYHTMMGRAFLKILVNPRFSHIAAWLLNSSVSRLAVPHFVKKNNIDLSKCEKQKYNSFNDFFTRKKIVDVCKIKGTVVSPCDGYLSIYRINGRSVEIKNCTYTISNLLRSEKLADYYNEGYCMIFRLEPKHYHRYIYISDAVIKSTRRIEGVLHSVRPVAFNGIPIYRENSREYTVMNSKELGTFIQMEVGALLVGKIQNHSDKGKVSKGDEKGYFEFGGSTIVVLFRKDRIKFVRTIMDICDTERELPVKIGTVIGTSSCF